jgi:hypothetical protein
VPEWNLGYELNNVSCAVIVSKLRNGEEDVGVGDVPTKLPVTGGALCCSEPAQPAIERPTKASRERPMPQRSGRKIQ